VRIIRGREDATAPLCLGLDAIALQEGKQVFAKEATEGAVKEAAVGAIHGDELS